MTVQDKILIHSVLKRLEWQWETMGTPCPVCREGYKYGHRPDCELNKCIAITTEAEKQKNLTPTRIMASI